MKYKKMNLELQDADYTDLEINNDAETGENLGVSDL